MDDDGRPHALEAVLRVAARHPNLLDREAFEEVAEALAGLTGRGRITVLVPEGPASLRIYAMSTPSPVLGFGARVPSVPSDWHTVFVEGLPLYCDDMREGNEITRSARGSDLSYVGFPCRVTRGRPKTLRRHGEGFTDATPDATRVVALLLISYPEVGAARRVPADELQAIADAIAPAIERATHLAREHRLAMILETSGDAMLAWDRQGLVADANSAAAVLSGRPRSQLLGTPVAELLDPVPVAGTHATFTEGARLALLARVPGGMRRVTVAATVTAVEHDALVAWHALLRDLTAVERAEYAASVHLRRIHELEEQHRTLLDNAPLIIFRLSPPSDALAYLNRHAERLLGVPTAEALATPRFLRAAHADAEGAAAFDAAVAEAHGGARSPPYEARLRRRDGGEITVRGIVYPLLAEDGGVAAIEGVLADVSAEHAARARLVQVDRLSTLGTLAAGVAHEINNPAAFMLLGLDLLDRLLSGEGVEMEASVAASARETLHELRDSIRRIVDIARDLRLFAAPPGVDGARKTIIDVNRTVESALSLTRGQILERAQIERQLEDVPPVLMDDGRLGQVLVNLLVNAAQAIPKSYTADHRITVATRSDGRKVEIEVRDTGVGIPDETLARIWQPFFTTKSPDVGTGLGLSISREIVERAGGSIMAESPSPGPGPGGTRFVIRLPVASPYPTVPPPPPSPLPEAPAPGRVLIVEDEPSLARALAEEIGRWHDVVVASGAEAAFAALGAQGFDAVLCDLRMPGMSGEAFYARILEQAPDQAEGFVFMTGVGFGADVERFLSESGRPVLEKPFSAAQALDTLARVLKRRAL
jgi:PAS domain S-box-containing protein